MYAIIKTGGKQYKVSAGEALRVERLNHEIGAEVEITDVLMVVNGADIKIGAPVVTGAAVRASVVEHGLGKKILMMKKKRRKGYKLKKGHRQPYTTLEIKEIKV
ncbi:MAG: 50S ribosomal protein L21 [Desulfobacteraceae bacterium]|nr:50S ribosomal protein L21 [Desulfobacteraceae bacterium]